MEQPCGDTLHPLYPGRGVDIGADGVRTFGRIVAPPAPGPVVNRDPGDETDVSLDSGISGGISSRREASSSSGPQTVPGSPPSPLVDREQVRRDAERTLAYKWRGSQASVERVRCQARDILALLAELEQAEQERDEEKQRHEPCAERIAKAAARIVQAERERDDLYEQNWPWEWVIATREKERRQRAEARLAAVPALVEALRQIERAPKGDPAGDLAHAALAAFEQAQEKR